VSLSCYVALVRGGGVSQEKEDDTLQSGKLQISDPMVSLTSGVVEGLAIGMTETNLQGELQAGQLMNSEERKSC
jgi:hypothetical protein